MKPVQKIFAIIGSASSNSANLKLVQKMVALAGPVPGTEIIIFDRLAELPHFSPELSVENTPEPVLRFRQAIADAQKVLICTPEYVFSIPAGLKNAIEWCVSTTVFSDKPIAIVTAAASGVKAHEELKLIMKTLGADLTDSNTLLIQGIKGKMDDEGNMLDKGMDKLLQDFINSFLLFDGTAQKKPGYFLEE